MSTPRGKRAVEDPTEGHNPQLSAEALEQFWELGEEFDALRFSIEAPRVPEAVLKRLGSPFPEPDGDVSTTELARMYRLISERAIRSAYDET